MRYLRLGCPADPRQGATRRPHCALVEHEPAPRRACLIYARAVTMRLEGWLHTALRSPFRITTSMGHAHDHRVAIAKKIRKFSV
jgi:hypothetical protein